MAKIWWSKDQANHGGSEYKLFIENRGGYKWIADVDGSGKVIPKHKSETGKNLEKKDINWVK